MTVPQDPQSSRRLWLYRMAAGAGAVVAGPAISGEIQFDPPGGLPIIVDTTNTVGSAIEVDLNGDTVTDFSFYYRTAYGGGFAISSNFSQTSAERGRVQQTPEACCVNLVHRIDETEFVHPGENITYAPGFQFAFTFPVGSIDHGADAGLGLTAYMPFRDRPGFIGVSIGERGVGEVGFAGQFLVNVSADGQQLTILDGSYRDDSFDLRVGPLHVDGFESANSPYFPPSAPPTLDNLAYGATDAGAQQ